MGTRARGSNVRLPKKLATLRQRCLLPLPIVVPAAAAGRGQFCRQTAMEAQRPLRHPRAGSAANGTQLRSRCRAAAPPRPTAFIRHACRTTGRDSQPSTTVAHHHRHPAAAARVSFAVPHWKTHEDQGQQVVVVASGVGRAAAGRMQRRLVRQSVLGNADAGGGGGRTGARHRHAGAAAVIRSGRRQRSHADHRRARPGQGRTQVRRRCPQAQLSVHRSAGKAHRCRTALHEIEKGGAPRRSCSKPRHGAEAPRHHRHRRLLTAASDG
jgi:hypothetical protein